MKINYRIIRLVILILSASWFSYTFFQSFTDDFFFDVFIYFITGGVFIGLLIWSIPSDIKTYKSSRKFSSFITTLLGILFISIIITRQVYHSYQYNSPTLIRAFHDGGFNGFSVDLKENGKYIMANGSGFGQFYFYGDFTIDGSIITLDKDSIDNVIKSNLLMIRPIKDGNNGAEYSYYFVQIDENLKDLDSPFKFRIVEDNR
jgi:hypothetical protein